jgi:hypothetical protein
MTRRSIVFGFAPAIVLGQERRTRAKKVLDEALAALGGDRYLQMKDRTEAGRVYSFYRERLSGASHARIFTRYLTRPEPPRIDFFGQRERQSFGKDNKEESAVLFTENEAWQITFRGARPAAKDVEERYRLTTLNNIFYILRQRMGEPGMILEHEGTEVVENMPVEVVTITDAENRVVKAFFHSSTKLPVLQEWVRRDEKTRDRFVELSRYSKYRDVSGIQWPFQIQRDRDGEKIYEIFSERVSINNDLQDDLFALNTKIKVLPPAR